jgi:hypothetical protein
MFKLNLGVSPASVILRVFLSDSSATTFAGKTGLTSASSGLIISTIKNGEATPTAYTQAGSTIETIATLGTYAAPTASKCRFKEVDATNHPGLYEIQLADARLASTPSLIVTISGVSNLRQEQIEVQCLDLAAAALGTTTFAEPAQGAPAATATLAAKINYLYKAWRNKKSQDATTFKLYADDGTTVDHKATVADDGTTASVTEKVTGP